MASLGTEVAASSSTDHRNYYTYDVFLSFRGGDTRHNFIDHLHTALCQRGIKTFIDDELRRGEEILEALVKAIEESRVSVVVFSQNYASSRWCLDELDKILECRKSKGQEVRSVFYKVDPSDVRHQRGAFGKAFATLDQHKHKDSMEKWKAALTEAANLSGWPFKDGEYEAKFVSVIVGELCAQVINPSCELHVAQHPVGLESCREDINRHLLFEEEHIVRMVGIWGPGGIGKTTIAKYVFNSFGHKFDGSCFLENVRSDSPPNSNDLVKLQKRLLSQILRDNTLEVSSVPHGVSLIKARMGDKKVLLILDDVSHFSQLQNLVPSRDCFGPGSRIIITTRDVGCLTPYRVDEVYQVKLLCCNPALELFCWNAFKTTRPPDDFLELARSALHYAQGLPLALIVFGASLFGREREEWEAALDSCRCKRGDHQNEIINVLRISYDALAPNLQELFLDVACFFKGEQLYRVKEKLDSCYGIKSAYDIARLQEMALIGIYKDDRRGIETVWMHDLLEEMGRDIVIQESPGEPGERSRIWSADDVNHVLTNKTGTIHVRGIQVSEALQRSTISLDAECFTAMKNLRYLCLPFDQSQSFSGDIEYLSDQLRLLHWPQYPSQYFPFDFHAKDLAELSICDSRRLTRLWKEDKEPKRICDIRRLPRLWKDVKEPKPKKLEKLTRMDLSNCKSLRELPEFDEIPNLKELKLLYCTSLVTVSDSLGWLEKLVTLDVTGCTNLIMLPRKVFWKSLEEIQLRSCGKLTALPHNIHESQNLQVLDASYCYKLAAFPEISTKMGSLRILNLSFTCIRELDDSIGNLIGLELLHLNGCRKLRRLPSSIYGLQNLVELDLNGCSKLVEFPSNSNILNGDGCSLSLPKLKYLYIRRCGLSDCDFLTTLDCWETLKCLAISRNDFVSLPYCLTKFVNLEGLHFEDYERLGQLPELPPNVRLYRGQREVRELREAVWKSYLLVVLAAVFGLLSVWLPFRDRASVYESPDLISDADLLVVLIVSIFLPPITNLIYSLSREEAYFLTREWATVIHVVVVGLTAEIIGVIGLVVTNCQAPVVSLTDVVVVFIEIVLLQQIETLINYYGCFVRRCRHLCTLEFVSMLEWERALGQLPGLPPNARLYRVGPVRLTDFSCPKPTNTTLTVISCDAIIGVRLFVRFIGSVGIFDFLTLPPWATAILIPVIICTSKYFLFS